MHRTTHGRASVIAHKPYDLRRHEGAGEVGDPATGSVTPEQQQAIQRTVHGMFKEMVPRAVADAIKAAVPSIVEAMKAGQQPPTPAPGGDPPPGNPAGGVEERATLKSLHAAMQQQDAQMKAMREELAAERKRTAEATQQGNDARNRAEVASQLSKRLGAENPAVPLLLDSLYDVKKRFGQMPDGRLGVRFTDQGFEEWKPLEEGVKALFDGELKQLAMPAPRTPGLPPAGIGRPMVGQQALGGAEQVRQNPIMATFGQMIAETHPAAGQALAAMAIPKAK